MAVVAAGNGVDQISRQRTIQSRVTPQPVQLQEAGWVDGRSSGWGAGAPLKLKPQAFRGLSERLPVMGVVARLPQALYRLALLGVGADAFHSHAVATGPDFAVPDFWLCSRP